MTLVLVLTTWIVLSFPLGVLVAGVLFGHKPKDEKKGPAAFGGDGSAITGRRPL